jgi:hypothetical protein
MLKTKEQIFLDRRTLRAFAGVRGRVKAAVAAQPHSVSLSQALEQMQKSKVKTVMVKSRE